MANSNMGDSFRMGNMDFLWKGRKMKPKEQITAEVFQRIKEDRLEKLIRGGWLKRPGARQMLCGFTGTVRRTLRGLTNEIY